MNKVERQQTESKVHPAINAADIVRIFKKVAKSRKQ